MLKKLSCSLLLFIVFSGVFLQKCTIRAPKDPEDPEDPGGGWDFDIEGKTEMPKEVVQITSSYRDRTGWTQKFVYNHSTSWEKIYKFTANKESQVSMSIVVTGNAALIGKYFIVFYYSDDGVRLHQSIRDKFRQKHDPTPFFFMAQNKVRDAGNVRVVLFFTLGNIEYFTQLPMINVVTG